MSNFVTVKFPIHTTKKTFLFHCIIDVIRPKANDGGFAEGLTLFKAT